jgi:hypothetical protein
MKVRGHIDIKWDKKDWIYFMALVLLVGLIFHGDIREAAAFVTRIFSK